MKQKMHVDSFQLFTKGGIFFARRMRKEGYVTMLDPLQVGLKNFLASFLIAFHILLLLSLFSKRNALEEEWEAFCLFQHSVEKFFGLLEFLQPWVKLEKEFSFQNLQHFMIKHIV